MQVDNFISGCFDLDSFLTVSRKAANGEAE